MKRPSLLIVEDQEGISSQLRRALSDEYDVAVAGDGTMAIRLFDESRPDLVTLDLGLPPEPRGVGEGMRVLARILGKNPGTKVVVVTGADEADAALMAIRLGAFDFYQKPIALDELRLILKRAAHIQRLERLNESRDEAPGVGAGLGDLVGGSPPMLELFELIRRIGRSSSTVLVIGESGTGKELIARAIHEGSTRKDGPFVAINAGAIPETLLEAELFGHEKGAFTGAHARRVGRVERAHGGTLFLDETGELPPMVQVKLLRFLQEREIERVGGRDVIPVDVRVIAATNSDLEKAIADGRFREDLYYRLKVVTIRVPPLRERGEDIPLLANAFLKRFREEAGAGRIRGFSPEALAALQAYVWPGNVRELENRVQRALVVASGSLITPADLELESASHEELTLRSARDRIERKLVIEALVRCRGNVTQAAKEIDVTRPTFHALMNKFGLRTEDFRG